MAGKLVQMSVALALAMSAAPAVAATDPARPNILLIVADDLGYNDLGAFGSEIRTPNIDRLAAQGATLTSYYTAPLCAPTRAMLLSGADHHRAGMGVMGQPVEGAPGYEGYLNDRVISLATRLQSAGYHTYMAGKWHLGDEEAQGPAARGFERSFALLQGAADHFTLASAMPGAGTTYRDDGKIVDKLPADFYSTNYYTDRMLNYLESGARDGKPFFAYLAYTAPHWPVQAPDADIARQRGRYDEGYDVLRQRRFEAWKARGFAPKDAELPNLPANYKPWTALSASEKAASARTMEVYAAMVERMDSEIGRVLRHLERTGQLENTLVIFQSDNGAEGSGMNRPDAQGGVDAIGRPGSWNSIGSGWAEAGSVPFYLQKYWATEGGIRVPAIVSAPKLGVRTGYRTDSLLMAYDIAPTVLDLAGVSTAAPAGKADSLPITGRSFLAILRGDESGKRSATDMVGWEHRGNAAVRRGDWKLVWVGSGGMGPPPGGAGPGAGPGGPPGAMPAGGPPPGAGGPGGAARGAPMPGMGTLTRASLEAGGPAGTPTGSGGPWRLHNVREDPAERHDLSAKHPDLYQQMLGEWDRYVAENGVIVKTGS